MCIVLDSSCPVLSAILLAARPVGAMSCTSVLYFSLWIYKITFKTVVLPVPGPPVIMLIGLLNTIRTASF